VVGGGGSGGLSGGAVLDVLVLNSELEARVVVVTEVAVEIGTADALAVPLDAVVLLAVPAFVLIKGDTSLEIEGGGEDLGGDTVVLAGGVLARAS
jgi:hypothetical protein